MIAGPGTPEGCRWDLRTRRFRRSRRAVHIFSPSNFECSCYLTHGIVIYKDVKYNDVGVGRWVGVKERVLPSAVHIMDVMGVGVGGDC